MEEHYQEERDKQHHPTSWHPYSPCRPYGWYGLRQLLGRQWSMGVIFFIADMFLMFLASTICHLPYPGTCAWCHAPSRPHQHTRHDSLLLSPICVSVLGGAVSWTVFAILWPAAAKMAAAGAQ